MSPSLEFAQQVHDTTVPSMNDTRVPGTDVPAFAGMVSLPAEFDGETVWLTRNQMAELYGRDVKTIGKHIGNALREELAGEENRTVAKFATVQMEGEREVSRVVEHYNLDMILSVGYRVKSKRGVEFRRWATQVLRRHIVEGHTENERRLIQLGQVARVMKRLGGSLEANQILSVVESYSRALDLLDAYDHQTIARPSGNRDIYWITYDECRTFIDGMRFGRDSDLFGNEKDESFRSSIGAIYQSFDGEDIYPSLEEQAANLLYFVVKNHSFSDGNKRIAAGLFLCFLDRNGALFSNGRKRLDDNTLVALTIMIAESRPAEKEAMVSLVMNFLL